MKIYNVVLENPKWIETEDGFLKCKAHILAERIMEYAKDEIDELPEGIEFPDKIRMYVPKQEIFDEESLKSLEGALAVAGDHMWLNPGNVALYDMGHVAGTPIADGDYLDVELFITNPTAIQAIKDKKIGEISGAYNSHINWTPGTFNGQQYDAIQERLRWNHIAVIPDGTGRAGSDIRIFNNKKDHEKEKNIMTEEKKLVRVKLKNTNKFVNVDEETADKLENEEMAADEVSKKTFEEVTNELSAKADELAEAQTIVEGLKGELAAYQAKVDELQAKLDEYLAGGNTEEAALEMVGERDEAMEVLENSDLIEDEKEKEEVMNSIKNFKLKGKELHEKILNAAKIDTAGMSEDSMSGAFRALKVLNKKTEKKVPGSKIFNMPKETKGNQPTRTPLERLGYKVAK